MDDENDDDLWVSFTSDIKALEKEKSLVEEPPLKTKKKPVEVRPKTEISAQVQSQRAGDGLDRKTSERFRKGQRRIEASLDLHGMTQDEAHPALHDFIKRAYAGGKRCVLVITGKGADGEGVLKRMAPEWLAQSAVKDLILKTAPAQPRDGGEGALYILLRRKR